LPRTKRRDVRGRSQRLRVTLAPVEKEQQNLGAIAGLGHDASPLPPGVGLTSA
jgi:hypothetical protein